MENPVLMLSVSEAKQRILAKIKLLDPERVPLAKAVGRVLASPGTAEFDLPPFPNSAMDGFAVRSKDVATATRDHPVNLKIIADIPAGGFSSGIVGAGEAMRIMTGAALPDGADAVIPVEETDFASRQAGAQLPTEVHFYGPVDPGSAIRPRGQDVRAGETVLEVGRKLRPQDIGLLSMLGISQVSVYRRPRVALFSTGDELVPVDEPLSVGKIHDANSSILTALATQAGGEALFLGVAHDEEADVRLFLERGEALEVDLIVSSAGVSVGAFDFVRAVVEQEGTLDFWRVNMRPGKPIAFGDFHGIPFWGLPGNPVSAFVGFEVFVRPAIQRMIGLPDERRRVRVHLAETLESDGRENYLRAVVDFSNWTASLTGHQGSGNLRSLVQANALIIIPSAVKSLPAGTEIEAWLLDA